MVRSSVRGGRRAWANIAPATVEGFPPVRVGWLVETRGDTIPTHRRRAAPLPRTTPISARDARGRGARAGAAVLRRGHVGRRALRCAAATLVRNTVPRGRNSFVIGEPIKELVFPRCFTLRHFISLSHFISWGQGTFRETNGRGAIETTSCHVSIEENIFNFSQAVGHVAR